MTERSSDYKEKSPLKFGVPPSEIIEDIENCGETPYYEIRWEDTGSGWIKKHDRA